MKNSRYFELTKYPPKLEVVEGAKEVILEMVSCMCDNRHLLVLRKNNDGDFKLNSPPRNGGYGQALSNFQMKWPVYAIEWEADTGNWNVVFSMINSGTEAIESVKSR